jgi:pimeloyl-ACP methyl ester carboxylesterase
MKVEFVVLLIFIIAFIAFLIVMGERILVSSIIRPKKSVQKTPVPEIRFQNERRFTVNSSSGVPISFLYIPLSDDGAAPEKIVFLFHGYNSSGEAVKKYAEFFLREGFSVIIPDNRFCGHSGGENLGLAVLDANDTLAIFNWIKDCFPGKIPVGLFGESFGAAQAIILAASSQIRDISFVISDSSFSDLYTFLKERVRVDYRIKAFPLLTIATVILKKKYGIDAKNTSPLRSLSKCGEIPMFFIHGENDTYILPQMSIDLYNAKNSGYKKFFLAEGAGHCAAYESDPDTYEEKLKEFLDKINI